MPWIMSQDIGDKCISEREWQIERVEVWDKGRRFDTFGPIGHGLVTRNEINESP